MAIHYLEDGIYGINNYTKVSKQEIKKLSKETTIYKLFPYGAEIEENAVYFTADAVVRLNPHIIETSLVGGEVVEIDPAGYDKILLALGDD